MNKKNKFIALGVLLMMLISAGLSFKMINADNKNSVSFSTGITDERLDDTLVFDLYYVGKIGWDGSSNPTKYYVDPAEIVEIYQDQFKDIEKGTDGLIDIGKDIKTGDMRTEIDLDGLAQGIMDVVYNEKPDAVTDSPFAFGTKHENLEDGIYLAVIHGSKKSKMDDYVKFKVEKSAAEEGSDDSQEPATATETKIYYSYEYSQLHEYRFQPILIFLKNTDLQAVTKQTIAPRYSDLIIKKNLSGFAVLGENEKFKPVSFVYSIKAYDKNNNLVFDDVATLKFDKIEELEKETLVKRIPCGSRVVVKEIYTGSYVIDEEFDEKETNIVVSPLASVEFTNKFNDDPKHGYGLDNKYINTDGKWSFGGRDIPSPVPGQTTDGPVNGETNENGTTSDGGNS